MRLRASWSFVFPSIETHIASSAEEAESGSTFVISTPQTSSPPAAVRMSSVTFGRFL